MPEAAQIVDARDALAETTAKRRKRRARLGYAALASIAVACGVMAQGPGWNQNSHYALIRGLADGTPTI